MRIASLVPSATEMLFALGLGDSVVAVTHECDYPPEARSLPHLTRTVLADGPRAPREIDTAVKATVGEGRALYELDEELLAELAPDLIVTQAICDVCAVSYEDVVEVAARLPSRPRVLQQDPSTLGEMLEDVIRLGEATGIEAAGARAARRARGPAGDASAPPSRGADAAAGDRAGVARPALRRRPLDPGDDLDRRRRGRRRPAGPEVARGRLGRALGPQPRRRRSRCPAAGTSSDSRAQALEHWDRIEALGAGRVFAVDAASTFSRPGPAPRRRGRAARPPPPPRPGRPAGQHRLRRAARAAGRAEPAERSGDRRARRRPRRRRSPSSPTSSAGRRRWPEHAALAGDDRPGRRATPPTRPPRWPPMLISRTAEGERQVEQQDHADSRRRRRRCRGRGRSRRSRRRCRRPRPRRRS